MSTVTIPRRSGTRYQAWRSFAACKGADPALFFPAEDAGRNATRAAKAICADCPVRVPCLRQAVDDGERWGVWGGLAERERRGVKPSGLRTCASGRHLMTPDNIYVYPGNGAKACRACRTERDASRVRDYSKEAAA